MTIDPLPRSVVSTGVTGRVIDWANPVRFYLDYKGIFRRYYNLRPLLVTAKWQLGELQGSPICRIICSQALLGKVQRLKAMEVIP